MKKSRRIRKIILWTFGIVALAVVLVIAFISPLTKYMVQKYDEKLLGRQVEMDLAYVNPFTGYLHFSNVKIYEANSDSIFLRSEGLSANFSVYKMLRGTYEITEIKLNKPVAYFIQHDSTMNLDDIVQRFSSKDTVQVTEKKEVKFSINSIIIEDGEFHYIEQVIPINYYIKHVDIQSTGFHYDADTMRAMYAFVPGNGKGTAKGDLTINTNNQDYRFNTVLNKYDLKFLEQYLLDVARYGNFDANLDANVHATGNFKDAQKLDARGLIGINDFRFGKNEGEDYASFKKLVVDITQLNPAQHKYTFDSAILTQPYVKYDRYDFLDNFTYMFSEDGEKVSVEASASSYNLIFEIADYVAILAKNFFKSDYKVNKIAIVDANLNYNDYTLNEKFSASVNPFNVFADSIAKSKDRVKVALWSGIKPYGSFAVNISINPKDSSDFDMNYKIGKLPLAMLNPYLLTYTSFPMDRGTIEVSGNWHVRNGSINSDNRILVVDPRLGKRIKRKDAQRLPLPLIMYFVKERGNVIDYEVPVTGNLNHPKFHLRDVIFDIISNIFAKPPTTPYRIKVRQVETEIEKSLSFRWEMRQTNIMSNQEKFVEKIADFLRDNGDARIVVTSRPFEDKEKEYILFYMAKKKYFLQVNEETENEFTMEDSIRIERMSIRDSLFLKHLNKFTNGKTLHTIQDKCLAFVGRKKVEAEYARLVSARKKAFLAYFASRGVDKQVNFGKVDEKIPFNGFSFYKLEYKGELPYALYKAYSEMNELDNTPPRRRFKKDRRKRKLPDQLH